VVGNFLLTKLISEDNNPALVYECAIQKMLLFFNSNVFMTPDTPLTKKDTLYITITRSLMRRNLPEISFSRVWHAEDGAESCGASVFIEEFKHGPRIHTDVM